MANSSVRYFIFDIESVADGDLISKVRYPGEALTPEKAIETYAAERMEQFGSEFIPYTFHLPVSIAVIKINADFKILDIVTLDAPKYRPHALTKLFWDGWKAYKMPTLVTFNGRTFDIPLLELAAFRFGIAIPQWFNIYAKNWEQKRGRYNQGSHLDLQDIITNFGATRLNGGLNLCANIVGRPGKMGVAGHMVQSLFNEGKMQEINDYCRCDVLDTYFVFLRTAVLMGDITLDREIELVAQTQAWLAEQAEEFPVYQEYLDQCEVWINPWDEADEADPVGADETDPVSADETDPVSANETDPVSADPDEAKGEFENGDDKPNADEPPQVNATE